MASSSKMGRRKKQLKKPPLEDDTSNLPCDIIQNILSRLPVKSLCRFKSVSKPWNSTISSAQFARVHLNQSKISASCGTNLICSPKANTHSHQLFKFTNIECQLVAAITFPVKKYRECFSKCSYDGLVLLKARNAKMANRRYVIWNPSTRKHMKFSCSHRIQCNCSAICYDQATDDYKILFLENGWYGIYSIGNNSWTEKKCLSSRHHIPYCELVVVHGTPHWVVKEKCREIRSGKKEELRLELLEKECKKHDWYRGHHRYINHPVYERDYDDTHEICYFDPTDENLKKLPKPVCLDDSCVFHVASLRNQLCLFRNSFDLTMMEIWMMKEYGNPISWTKLLTIDNMCVPNYCQKVEPLCFTSEGNIVIDIYYCKFVIYSPSNQKLGELKASDFWGYRLVKESLILPSRINRTKRKQSETRLTI